MITAPDKILCGNSNSYKKLDVISRADNLF